MAIPDDELATALRTLLQMTTGFYFRFVGMLEIGQLENLNYWVVSRLRRESTVSSETRAVVR
jgi:hypothetical protein